LPEDLMIKAIDWIFANQVSSGNFFYILFNNIEKFHEYCYLLKCRNEITKLINSIENPVQKAVEKVNSLIGKNLYLLSNILAIFDEVIKENGCKIPKETATALENFLTKNGTWKQVYNFFKKM